jgi:multidrug efflux system membrane fusion protein
MRKYLAARQSFLIASIAVVALVLWLSSGQLGDKPVEAQSAQAPAQSVEPVMSVRVRELHAQDVTREIIVSGRTEPARIVTVRAEIDGRIVAVNAERGQPIKQGDVIARIDMRDLEARLTEARATVKQREMQYAAAQKLLKQNLQSQVDMAERLAQLETARAQLKRTEVEVANTTMAAPFDGVLEDRNVEVGDYVKSGDQVARVLEQNPMLVIGDVNERERGHLHAGDPGFARLATGQAVQGRLRYVAAEADPATRTFRIELEVPNPDGALVAGVTSEIRIPSRQSAAHYLSPAFLSLDDNGQVGIKTVNTDDVVEFFPAKILRSTNEGIWVTGLPETVRVITVGQGFVRPGDRVHPMLEPSPSMSGSQGPDA